MPSIILYIVSFLFSSSLLSAFLQQGGRMVNYHGTRHAGFFLQGANKPTLLFLHPPCFSSSFLPSFLLSPSVLYYFYSFAFILLLVDACCALIIAGDNYVRDKRKLNKPPTQSLQPRSRREFISHLQHALIKEQRKVNTPVIVCACICVIDCKVHLCAHVRREVYAAVRALFLTLSN